MTLARTRERPRRTRVAPAIRALPDVGSRHGTRRRGRARSAGASMAGSARRTAVGRGGPAIASDGARAAAGMGCSAGSWSHCAPPGKTTWGITPRFREQSGCPPMRAAAGCCCNGSMNDTTYAYDAGGAAARHEWFGFVRFKSVRLSCAGPQPKPKRQSDRFFSWIRGSAMERGDDRWIAGVCSAIAQRVGWSPTLVRALVLASVVLCGFGLALYAIAWALLPDARDGRILGEELIDGRWDWNMLGVIIMMMLAVAVPGAGLAAACAALVLWLVQNANRRHGGYGSGSGVSGTGDSENGSYRRGWPASSYAYDGADTGEQAADAGTAGSSADRAGNRGKCSGVLRSVGASAVPAARSGIRLRPAPYRRSARTSSHAVPVVSVSPIGALFHRNTSAASRPVSPSSSA